jgi:hypothetical protein
MTGIKAIQGKALLLLVTFISNFFVVCDCQAHEAPAVTHRHSCCCGEKAGTAQHPSSHEDNDCPATHAVKFNLLEKQAASTFFAAAPMVAVVAEHFIVAINDGFAKDETPFRKIYFYKHSPPDFHSLYQRFLI